MFCALLAIFSGVTLESVSILLTFIKIILEVNVQMQEKTITVDGGIIGVVRDQIE